PLPLPPLPPPRSRRRPLEGRPADATPAKMSVSVTIPAAITFVFLRIVRVVGCPITAILSVLVEGHLSFNASIGLLESGGFFFREHDLTMDEAERKELAETLAKADLEFLREIIREGEAFLAAQLQAGLASDLRAMTFAAVIAAVLAFIAVGVA